MIAYKLLLQETYPSWLYPVKMGATTIWERWDGQKPDSSFQTPAMNSFNHYAYGAIGDWMYRNITGLDTYEEGAGYKKIRIQPHLGGDLSYASADLETGYGKLSVHWRIADGKFIMDVEVPANTSASIYLPSLAGHYENGTRCRIWKLGFRKRGILLFANRFRQLSFQQIIHIESLRPNA